MGLIHKPEPPEVSPSESHTREELLEIAYQWQEFSSNLQKYIKSLERQHRRDVQAAYHSGLDTTPTYDAGL